MVWYSNASCEQRVREKTTHKGKYYGLNDVEFQSCVSVIFHWVYLSFYVSLALAPICSAYLSHSFHSIVPNTHVSSTKCTQKIVSSDIQAFDSFYSFFSNSFAVFILCNLGQWPKFHRNHTISSLIPWKFYWVLLQFPIQFSVCLFFWT